VIVAGSLNVVSGLAHMLSHPYMRDAVIAGGAIAVSCGLVGHFMVMREQTFSGDALSHVAFTGSLLALVIGIDLRIGLFGGCVLVAVAMGLIGRLGRADDVVIGNLFAWILGLGVLFLSIYTSSRSGNATGATSGVTVLFGSVFGLSDSTTLVAVAIAIGVSAAMLAISRPLLYATVDESVAAARGVPVRGLGVAFLALVGIVAGEATQIVGALLLLGLLATPASAAQRIVANPDRAMAWSVVFCVGAVWGGLVASYHWTTIPPSFSILAIATTTRLAAGLIGHVHHRGRSTPRT
jgi:zinc/manganese transport system permease protein